MRRQRKRSRTLSAMTLGVMLIAGLLAPAAMAVDTGENDEVLDDVEVVDVEDDSCALHVDLVGSQLRKDLYSRANLRYELEEKTFRTKYTYDKQKHIPAVTQYRYANELRTREWIDGQDEIVEHEWQKQVRDREWRWLREHKDVKGWKWHHQQGWTQQNGANANKWFEVPAHLIEAANFDPRSISPTGTVPLSVYGGPHVSVQYKFVIDGPTSFGTEETSPYGPGSVKVDERWTDWADEGDVVTTDEKVAPGPDTDTEKWIYLGENMVQDGSDGDWGEWGEWTRIPGHETDWFSRERTRIYAHGTWWDIDEPRFLGDDESKQYRYTESDSRTKPGTDEWVTIIRNLGPTSSEPDTAPFSIGRFQYRYTNVQSHQVFSGWKTVEVDGAPAVSPWLYLGQKIETHVDGVSVWPGQLFSDGETTFRYHPKASQVRSMLEWVTEEVAGQGTTPPEGEGWVKIRTRVKDAEPNQVRVTINDEVVDESTFGDEFTRTYLLDHGDSYLVEYKLHGDEGWTIDQEGVADCDMPEALVDSSEWEESEVECDSEDVTLTRTTTTIPFIWDAETRTWVEDEANTLVEEETDTRALTDEEIAWQESDACIEVLDEVEEQPEEQPPAEPEVEQVSVEREVETQVLAETLPRTGASILALLMSGLLALFVGTSALRRRQNER